MNSQELNDLGFYIDVMSDDDRSFVANSFVASVVDSKDGRARGISEQRATMNAYVDRLLADEQVCWRVIRPVESPDVIVGWAAARGDEFIWAFVKFGYRRSGFGAALFEALGPLDRYRIKREPWTVALERRGLRYTP